MRKHYKNMIQELVKTLSEAGTDITELLHNSEPGSLPVLLEDCGAVAAEMCSYIEQLDGKGVKTVDFLKEYIELINRLKQCVQAGQDDSEQAVEALKAVQKQITVIENSVENDIKNDKFEIVFLPYRASMWDSFESVWLAAKDDPQCDAYVVPVPFFEVKPDQSLGEMHYDGDLFPKNVSITNWRDYDIEARHPDIIFTHYPYDYMVTNYSIHSAFYSEKLRKHCSRLINIPYYVFGNPKPDSLYCQLPGVLYARYVMVNSEITGQTYLKHYNKFITENLILKRTTLDAKTVLLESKDKFMALGSPKFDSVINAKREDYTLPEEWSRLINNPDGSKKTVVLYNTHMFRWIDGGEWYFNKVDSVFSAFRNRKDTVLWWRPHPNLELNFKVKRPDYYERYKELVKKYRSEGYGIYDDTADLHRSIACSDAYYGDGSSVLTMYHVTKKPALIQNIDIIGYDNNEPGKKYLNHKISLRDFKIRDNTLWGISREVNGLFSMDLNTRELVFHGKAPWEAEFNLNPYFSMELIGNEIILFPCNAKDIAKYNIDQGAFFRVPLASPACSGKFTSSYVYGDVIYALPYNYPALVQYNIKTGEVTENKKICVELQDKSGKDYCFRLGYASGKYLIAMSLGNTVVKYNTKTGKYSMYNVGNKDNSYRDIVFDGANYWLFPLTGNIVKWNEETGETLEINKYPDKYICNYAKKFSHAIAVGDSVLAFPYHSNMILKINTRTNETKQFVSLDERKKYSFKHEEYYSKVESVGEYIYAFSNYENCLQKIEPHTAEIENIPLCLSDDDYEKITSYPLFDGVKPSPFASWENQILTLDFFLQRLNSQTISDDFELTEEYLPANADGTAGKKIYEFAKGEALK